MPTLQEAKIELRLREAKAELIRRGKLQASQQPQPQQQQIQSQQDGGFLSNITTDLGNRLDNASNLAQQAVDNNRNPFAAGLGIAGQVAGAGTDVLGQSISSVADTVIPENVQQFLKDQGNNILQSDIGQTGLGAARQVSDKFQQFKQVHPDIATVIEAAGNIGQFAVPIEKPVAALLKPVAKVISPVVKNTASLVSKATPNVIKQPVLNTAKNTKQLLTNPIKTLDRSARRIVSRQREDIANNLIKPESIKALTEAQIKGKISEKNKLIGENKIKFEKAVTEKRQVDAIKSVKGIEKINSLSGQLKAIRDESIAIGEKITDRLSKNKATFIKKEVAFKVRKAFFNSVNKKLSLFGDGKPPVKGVVPPPAKIPREGENLLKQLNLLLSKSDGKIGSLLKLRQDFDQEIKDVFSDKVLNGVPSVPEVKFLKAGRNAINEMIFKVDKSIEPLLKRQSALISVNEKFAPKAAAEAKSFELFPKLNRLKNLSVISSLALGTIGGLSSDSIKTGIVLAIAGGLASEAGKFAVKNILTKTNLRRLLKATTFALKKAKNGSNKVPKRFIPKLRKDRLLLIGMINNNKGNQK